MLNYWEKRTLENEIEKQIRANPLGINTRTLSIGVYRALKTSIPNLNMHHVAGMLAWVYKSYGHRFLVRTPGFSIIIK